MRLFRGGRIVNESGVAVWILGDGRQLELPPLSISAALGIQDADGLLLDGRAVLLESYRYDLGGGRVWTHGAIKICDLGVMTILPGRLGECDLIVHLSVLGYISGFRGRAGYHDPNWCAKWPGWTLKAPIPGAR
jgi:hypothetical protein